MYSPLRGKHEFYFRNALKKQWKVFSSEVQAKFLEILLDIRDSYISSGHKSPYPTMMSILNSFNMFDESKLQLVLIGRTFIQGNGLCYADSQLNNFHRIMMEVYNKKVHSFNPSMIAWAKQGVLMLPKSFTIHDIAPKDHSKIWFEFLVMLCKEIDKIYSPVWAVVDYPELTEKLPLRGRDIFIPEFIQENLPALHQRNPFNLINDLLLKNNHYAIKWFNS